MTISENQARSGIALHQPEVHRQVVRLVGRGDTEHLVPGTHVSMDELHQYQLLGRRLQARAAAGAFASVFRSLVWPFQKLAAASARASREAAAIRQLSVLDDHLLADLGIHRGQIRAAVAGLMERPVAEQARPATSVESPRDEARTASNDPQAREAA
jgi:uncharacterized protein YjiS (DUF1127 family)